MLAQLVAHREEPVPSPRAVRPDVPKALDLLCRRMLAKEANDRPQSMAEVAAELDAIRAAARSGSARVRAPGGPPSDPALDLTGLLIDTGPQAERRASPSHSAGRPPGRGLRGLVTALAAASAGVLGRWPSGSSPSGTSKRESGRRRPRAAGCSPQAPPVIAKPAPRPAPPWGEVRRVAGHRRARPGPWPRHARWPRRQLLSCGDDGTVRLWNIESGAELHQEQAHRGPALGVAASPNGLEAISCGQDGFLVLWDLETWQQTLRLLAHEGGARSVAFAPDGGRALSGGADNLVRLWDLTAGAPLGRFVGHDRPVAAVAFSPDDLHALSASERALRLWDLTSQTEIAELKGHRGAVWCLAFSSDGRHALSAGADAFVRYWDVKARAQLMPVAYHKAPVHAVAFAPDGLAALSADEAGVLVYWDLPSGRVRLVGVPHRRFLGHEPGLLARWSPRHARVRRRPTPALEAARKLPWRQATRGKPGRTDQPRGTSRR